MADTIELEIVTPEKQVIKVAAEEVQIPGKSGYIGVLPGHAPLITELSVGEIAYRRGSDTTHISAAWGFAEILPDKVTILAETAERAYEIDVHRAEAARDRAEERLKEGGDIDYDRALNALRRAETRIDVAKAAGPQQ